MQNCMKAESVVELVVKELLAMVMGNFKEVSVYASKLYPI